MGAPTVADDITLIDVVPSGMQSLLDTAKSESNRKRYKIHPLKSETTSARKKPTHLQLGPNPVPYVNSVTHLGIDRSIRASNNTAINNRVSAAIKTMYALMPSGLHGEFGLTPHASRKIITSYVLPRLIYGLEALVISRTELSTLERAYKQLLKSLLALREGTADEAVYFLMGLPPVEAELDMRILSIFGNITRLPYDHPLKRIAHRQISLPGKEGWFKMVIRVAAKYKIDAVLKASLLSPWSKASWKFFFKSVVLNSWLIKMKQNAESKSSLRFMKLEHINSFSAHHLWPRGGCSSRSRVAASYRAKFISGSYILQANRARFNQNSVDPTCPLCQGAPEDLPHFFLSCPSLNSTRQRHLPTVMNIATALGLPLPTKPDLLCKSILNMIYPKECSACLGRNPKGDGGVKGPVSVRCKCLCTKLTDVINNLCLDLHNCRSEVLSRKGKTGS